MISELLTFSTISFSPWQIIPVSALWFAIVIIVKDGSKEFVNIKNNIRSEQKAISVLISILIIVYLLAPSSFGGGSYFNCRIPWVIFLLFLPLLSDLNIQPKNVINFSIMLAAILSICINSAILMDQNKYLSTFVSGSSLGCSKGNLIMLYYKPKPKLWSKIDTILHAPSYYGISNGCIDVGNYEVRTPYFPIKFKYNMASSSLYQFIEEDPDSIDFSKYPQIVEVIGWDLHPVMEDKLDVFYNLSYSNEKLTLWRRR